MIMNDTFFMRAALYEASIAMKMGEVPIGAVLVDVDGNIIASAGNRCISMSDPTAHAEILAIRHGGKEIANYRLLKTTLYVTVEPCPMCMAAAVHARIKRLVYGAIDPKWGAAGSVYNMGSDGRLNHKIEIRSGVLENECRKIIQDFFRSKRQAS